MNIQSKRPASEILHPAALARRHARYSGLAAVSNAVKRAITQDLAARGTWGCHDDSLDDLIVGRSSYLVREYLAYTSTVYPDGAIYLHHREYAPSWKHESGAWHPVMPWQALERNPSDLPDDEKPVKGGGHLYGMDWFDSDEALDAEDSDSESVGNALAMHVDSQIMERFGIEPPPWFDHPCPVDGIANWTRDQSAYLSPEPELYERERTEDINSMLLAEMERMLADEIGADGSIDPDMISCDLSMTAEYHAVAMVRLRGAEFVRFVSAKDVTDDPRGDFIKDTIDELADLRDSPITWHVADRVISAMSEGCSEANQEFLSLATEFLDLENPADIWQGRARR